MAALAAAARGTLEQQTTGLDPEAAVKAAAAELGLAAGFRRRAELAAQPAPAPEPIAGRDGGDDDSDGTSADSWEGGGRQTAARGQVVKSATRPAAAVRQPKPAGSDGDWDEGQRAAEAAAAAAAAEEEVNVVDAEDDEDEQEEEDDTFGLSVADAERLREAKHPRTSPHEPIQSTDSSYILLFSPLLIES